MDNNNSFHYTYSAKQQEEIRSIREKYLPQEEDKMEYLRRLDESVTKKATTTSLFVGIFGALILGVGMCCTMVWADRWFFPGIVIGLAGIALLSSAYPIYTRISARERERIAPEIIKLTDELMK